MSEELIREIINRGAGALTSLAEVAKVTAEHLYGVLVRQAMIEGITQAGAVVIWVTTMLIFSSKLKPKQPLGKWDENEGISYVIVMVIVAITSFILIAILTESLRWVLNPEFYALKWIFNEVNK